jgi:glycosyltransferase involved in cell wall biosynthesis
MLSVLIPVKDWNPTALVESLANQLIHCGCPFEILVSDDSNNCESSEFYELLSKLPGISYFTRQHPLGRSANRNFLASKAKYNYLLFIDGDAGCENQNFIRNYLERLNAHSVLCGGTLYLDMPPQDKNCLLRWKYGKKREQVAARERNENPWKSFSTFNFLIPSKVFHRFHFDESIKGYGHEDTLFGIRLKQAGIEVFHLDNGLLHLGLEPAESYLSKVWESALNLRLLYENKAFPPGSETEIGLLKTWMQLKRLHLTWLINLSFRWLAQKMKKRLCGTNPSMLLLDLYKLGAISQID